MEVTVAGRRVFGHTGGRAFDPARPTVVFLHGAAMGHMVWALQVRYVAHHGRNALALDLAGMGRSEGPVLDSIEAYGHWLIQVLDAVGVDRAVLVGHSMGALVALEAAAQSPERVTGLALLGISYPMRVNPTMLEAARQNDHLAVEMMHDWAHGRAAHVGGFKQPGLWMIGVNMRIVEHAAPDVLYHCFRICNDYRGGTAAAAAVRCPVRFILGDRDLMAPAKAAAKLGDGIADSEMVILPDCGHMMMAERPAETLAALKSFV